MAQPSPKKARLDPGEGVLPVVRIGGVPEHFNYPFLLATERGLDRNHGVRIEFVEQGLGTGAMIKNLKAGETDLVVALTEGLVADIAGGSNVRILGTYVGSPLTWAISAAGKADPGLGVADLRYKTFGISRFGSGSQLMAYVLAMERGWDPQKDIKFRVSGKFDKLRDEVNSGATDAFMWETFTTKPFHDSGEVSRVGDITTPWPCFMVAALRSTVGARLSHIRAALAAVHEAAQIFHESLSMPQQIANHYGLKLRDAEKWYAGVKIEAHRFVSEQALNRALEVLVSAGVLPDTTTCRPEAIIDPRVAQLELTEIKKVRLYRSSSSLVRFLHTSLEAAGLASGKASYKDFLPYDQHHYGGVAAVDEAIRVCGIDKNSQVINIGSGMGGPARYISGSTGCQVLAVELQHDLHTTAQDLTDRTRDVSDGLAHVAGDFQQMQPFLTKSSYSAVVSWLTVLHFKNRRALLKQCYDVLRPGGVFFAADLCRVGALSVNERKVLRDEVYAYLSTIEEYKEELESVGFRVTFIEDRTAKWGKYTKDRCEKWAADEKSITSQSGEETYRELKHFYGVIKDLFEGGRVGGVVVAAAKPLGW